MNQNHKSSNSPSKCMKLIYIIGRYPELTTTFIEREIKTLHQLGGISIQTISIRHPLTMAATLPEYKDIRENTLYLTPLKWANFLLANLYYIIYRPHIYFGTFFYLLTHEHPDIKARLMTILHFGLGIYTAYLLRRQQFDHIHVHFIDRSVVIAMIVGRLLNKPYSLTAHANSIFVKRILIKEKIDNAEFMVTVSEHNKSFILSNYAGIEPQKIHILHPWVDLSHFTPSASQSTQQKFNILSVGRLVEKKGHIYLIEACHLLKKQGVDFECRIAGDGPLRSDLERRVNEYNLHDNVQLLGEQPQKEVIFLLKTWADVFALPCVIAKDGDRDGLPVSLAEAMAMELPVISTDIVGISELVQPKTGLLIPSRDPAALAEALKTIYIKSSSERAEMGRQGRAVIEAEFNLIKGTTQLGDLFRSILTGDTSAQSSNITHED